jgi:hypothetical protein
MEASERDTTDEWRVAPARAPATIAELEGRIDVAMATARGAEEAALEIGAASLEAAEQARRAAALAERASAAAVRAVEGAAPRAASAQGPPVPLPNSNGASPPGPDPFEERIAAFAERAERVMVRLQRLEAPESFSGLP